MGVIAFKAQKQKGGQIPSSFSKAFMLLLIFLLDKHILTFLGNLGGESIFFEVCD
jgi:hypothetical protein